MSRLQRFAPGDLLLADGRSYESVKKRVELLTSVDSLHLRCITLVTEALHGAVSSTAKLGFASDPTRHAVIHLFDSRGKSAV